MSRSKSIAQAAPGPLRPHAPPLPPEWRIVRRGGCAILQARPLADLPWLVHGFSTRQGGASRIEGRPALNLGFVEWDERARVEENRRLLARAIGARPFGWVALRQIHSAIVRIVSGVPAERLRGDALITRAPRLLLAVQTADCVPILLVDPRQRVAAAIHAGWRGTLARIAEKVVGDLRMHFGTRPQDAIAAIGPSIGGCCYEVGPEVVHSFAARFADAGDWFDEAFDSLSGKEGPAPFLWLQREPPGHSRPERALLDLVAANRRQLESAGLRPHRVFACGWCTACHEDWLFSYRREGQRTGRLTAVVGLRN